MPSRPGPMPGVIPSPNIWNHPEVYEQENRGVDPDGVIDAAIAERCTPVGADVLDIGCGTGFHLPRLARQARSVVGVEPHRPLLDLAHRRIEGITPDLRSVLRVVQGSAQSLPVRDSSIDLAQARWAYFFGPGCEPGLSELDRVLRPGGTAVVVDVDARRSTFGAWFRRALPRYDPVAVQRFWDRRGWHTASLDIRWAMPDRATFEAAVGIEFDPRQADLILAEHQGTEVDYAVALRWRTMPAP